MVFMFVGLVPTPLSVPHGDLIYWIVCWHLQIDAYSLLYDRIPDNDNSVCICTCNLVCSTVLLVFSPPLGSKGAFHLYYLTRMICVKFEDTLLRFANFIGVLWFKLILHHHESFGPSHCMSLSVPFPFPVLFLAWAWHVVTFLLWTWLFVPV